MIERSGRLRGVDYLDFIRGDLGLEPYFVDFDGGMGMEGEVEQLDLELLDGGEEVGVISVIDYIDGEISEYAEALEDANSGDADEVIYDDLAKLIALKVIYYETLVNEQGGEDEGVLCLVMLNKYEAFFESPKELDEGLWSYADEQVRMYEGMGEEIRALRWIKIREAIGAVIASRLKEK